MTKWKLSREVFGPEEFTFKEGDEVTIGRAMDNTLTLSSLVISRKHCVIRFHSNKAAITDSGSSNGVYVGLTKIRPKTSHELKSSDIIGIGWTLGASIVPKISDELKYMFKVTKEDDTQAAINRFKYQSENKIEEKLAAIDSGESLQEKEQQLSPIIDTKLSLKRKSDQIKCNEIKKEIKEEKRSRIVTINDDVILLSDSDHEAENVNSLSKSVRARSRLVAAVAIARRAVSVGGRRRRARARNEF